jgi:transposase
MRAALKAQINKTDRNDVRGIAQMMRAGLYRLRATLRSFGLKVGVAGTVKFEERIKELVDNTSDLAVLA